MPKTPDTPDYAAKLRASILNAAITGKLTGGTDGWKTVKLGEIADVQLGKMLDKTKNLGKEYRYLANISVRWGSFDLNNLKTTLFTDREVEKFSLIKGDILMCEGGEPGRCAIWQEEDTDIKYQKALHRIRLVNDKPEYICIYFEAIQDSQFFANRFTGSTIKHLPRERLVEMPIPLPPVGVQKEIVAKVEELMALAEEYGKAEEARRKLDAEFPEKLRKSILDLAIRGKLVAQDPNEQPPAVASVPDTPPYPLPKNWKWVKLGEICEIIRGAGIKRSETTSSGVQCIRYGEIYTTYGYSFKKTVSFVSEATADKCYEAHYGDVLLTLTGETEEEIAKATTYLGDERLVIGGDLAKITNHPFYPTLLVYFMFSPFMINQKAANSKGGMIVHIGKTALENLLIPLPPVGVQKEIVAKVEALFRALPDSGGFRPKNPVGVDGGRA